MFKQLWPTTIFEGDISDDFPDEDRLGLLEMSRKFVKDYPYTYYKDQPYASTSKNFIDPRSEPEEHPPNVNPDLIYPDCPYLKKFKKILIEKMRVILQFDKFPGSQTLDIETLFLPRIVEAKWKGYRQLPHYHRGADYFALYYMDLDVEEKKESIYTTTNGNLYLIDPVAQKSSHLGQTDSYRINPYPGLLVIHPTKIAHMTDTYYGDKDRCLIGVAIKIVNKRHDPYYNIIT